METRIIQSIAGTLHELGVVSREAGDLKGAKQQLEESLRMKRSLHGDKDHPDIAVTLHELGIVSARLEISREQSSSWRSLCE